MKPLRYNKPFLLMVLNAGTSVLFLEEGEINWSIIVFSLVFKGVRLPKV